MIELAILAILVGSNPRRITHTSQRLRLLSLLLIVVASAANAWSAARLITGLIHGTEGDDATQLLAVGGNIWLTNIVIFALWYWDLDRGGPGSRARADGPRAALTTTHRLETSILTGPVPASSTSTEMNPARQDFP